MRKYTSLLSIVLVFSLNLILSSCYTQLAFVEKQKVKQVEAEEADEYVTEADTIYYEEEEKPVYIREYYYDYPEVYRYRFMTYDPWWYWDDYYFGFSGYYGYYPDWYNYRGWYPYVVIYDPYYYDYYGGWYRWDRGHSRAFKPRPFARDGSALADGRSSRVSLGSNRDPGSTFGATRISTSASTPTSSRISERTSDRPVRTTLSAEQSASTSQRKSTEKASTVTKAPPKKDSKVSTTRQESSRRKYYKVVTSKNSEGQKIVRVRDGKRNKVEGTKDTKSQNSGTVKRANTESSDSPAIKSNPEKKSRSSSSSSSVSGSRSSSSGSSYSPPSRSSSKSSSSSGSSRSSSRSSSGSSSGSKRK